MAESLELSWSDWLQAARTKKRPMLRVLCFFILLDLVYETKKKDGEIVFA